MITNIIKVLKSKFRAFKGKLEGCLLIVLFVINIGTALYIAVKPKKGPKTVESKSEVTNNERYN